MFICCVSVTKIEAQNYDNAVGLRLGWGFAGSLKHFFTEDLAGEGIVNLRNSYLGASYFSVTALAQKHNPINDVPNLYWYYGGGAFAGFFSSEYTDSSNVNIGIAGNLGLDYTFNDIPLNLSIDWIPSISLTGGHGFGAEAGGIAARYILN
ncbi:hypothetical protein GCM10025777_53230 [Membranihabitans marinus]